MGSNKRLLIMAGGLAICAGVAAYTVYCKTLGDLRSESARRADQYRALEAARPDTPRPSYNPARDKELRELRERYTETSLPHLYEDLKDSGQWKHWGNVASYIALVGRNDTSARVVIEFIESDHVPPDLEEQYVGFFYSEKANSLHSLGVIGGSTATDFLMRVWKGNKAQELTEKWYSRTPALTLEYNPAQMQQKLRYRAAVGLALSQDPLIQKEIFDAYTLLRERVEARLKRNLDVTAGHRVFTEDELAEEHTLHGLMDALAFYEMVADRGMDAYWRQRLEFHGGIGELGAYLERYKFRY